MQEKIITGRKYGMAVLLGYLALLAAAVLAIIYGAVRGHVFFVVLGVLYVSLGWIALCGLRILKPQEALVLTLFGKYIGTLKGEGFYYVNPFCSAVNPAANTKLSQSGDVDGAKNGIVIAAGQTSGSIEVAGNKKISLKIMTLNNSRQKINDCLGNPVEIGIAVMWRVTDTAKAVFNVDNYKEYLSLQCDAALRNIVRIYPYDVAPGIDTTGDGDLAVLAGYPYQLGRPDDHLCQPMTLCFRVAGVDMKAFEKAAIPSIPSTSSSGRREKSRIPGRTFWYSAIS